MSKQTALRASLVISSLALTAPFAISMVALSGLAVLDGLRAMSVTVPLPWIVFFDGPTSAIALLFADPTRLLLFSFLALLLLAGWLIQLAVRSRRHLVSRPQFYLLAFGIACILGFAGLHRYEPAVRPASNAQLLMVEQPDWLTGIVRRSWVTAEIEGCAFEVFGWADDNTLVYRKWCGGYYDPHDNYAWKDGTPTPPRAYHIDRRIDVAYPGDLQALSRETSVYWSCVRPLLAKDYVHTYALSSRYPAASDASILSPDGKWVAFRAKHVYGPEDLLIVGHP